MNSNSENPIYICGTSDKKTGEISIDTICIYKNHKLVESIDIKTDSQGNFIPYKDGYDKSSHAHYWEEDSDGTIGRKPHKKDNIHPIDSRYSKLINDIIDFNKGHKVWKK